MSVPTQNSPHLPHNIDSRSKQSIPSCIRLNAPSKLVVNDNTSSTLALKPPSTSWLAGTWHVTHSTLPMWKTKRDVRITYTPLPPSPSCASRVGHEDQTTDRLDDMVSYRSLTAPPLGNPSTVHGVDRAAGPAAWDWHGKGWLALFGPLARSHWEILGWGMVPVIEGVKDTEASGAEEDAWVVTYFSKTLFTPAGIDICSRSPEGLSEATLKQIKAAMADVDHLEFKTLVESIFEIAR